MSFISIDVEADGPCPGLYSMVSFGAVIIDEEGLQKTFYGQVKPISDDYIPKALAVSNISRETHLTYDEPKDVMYRFKNWLEANCEGKPKMFSDNPAFDWQFINYYFHRFVGENPLGFSARRIGDLYCGLKSNVYVNRDWKKKYRKTKHTHHPVDDAKGNAEAVLAFKEKLNLKINF